MLPSIIFLIISFLVLVTILLISFFDIKPVEVKFVLIPLTFTLFACLIATGKFADKELYINHPELQPEISCVATAVASPTQE